MISNATMHKVNIFYFYAQQYAENLTNDSDIRKIDMTSEFWKEIEQEILNDELVDININAKVRMSKSTSGIAIAQEVFKLLIKHKKRKEDDFGMINIARDEQEYSKLMRDPNTAYTVILTDEINELEHTGENVTVERALNNVFSNVQAGRYVHRVSCSPKDTADPNADVFLEIISVDRVKKMTHAHLYYRMFKGGIEYKQLLGYVNIDVSELIEIWDKKVKKHFLKKDIDKNKYDKRVINKYRKEDFYTEYMCKKYEKMELITKKGIMKPRILDYAGIILDVENKLRKLAKLNILTRGTIKSYIKMYCRREKIPMSIVGEELMTQEIEGLLSLWKSYFKMTDSVKRIEESYKKGKITDDELHVQKDSLIGMGKEIMEVIQAQTEELEEYKKIKEEQSIIKTK